MRTREDYKIGKGGREKSRLPGISASGFFFGSYPKKEPKKCFPDYRCDIVKYAKTWLFRINTYLRAKGDRNECIFYF